MKLSKTSLAGTVSAALFAAALAPGLPTWAQCTLSLGGCVALALLGHASPDCPANCPGTDASGHRNKQLPLPLLPVIVLAVFVFVCMITSGCVSANPKATAADPAQPAFIVSPALASASNNAAALSSLAATATGTGPIIPLAVNGVFGLLGALSLAYAQHKSVVAQTLAEGVHAAGPTAVRAVLTSAADSTKFAAVATLLNSLAPAGQAPGDATPSTAPKT